MESQAVAMDALEARVQRSVRKHRLAPKLIAAARSLHIRYRRSLPYRCYAIYPFQGEEEYVSPESRRAYRAPWPRYPG
jgi:hypothetical protein